MLEICAELKADASYRHIPIILLAALAQESGQSEESWKKKWGADALLSKPFRVREVVAPVERFIAPAPELTPESPSPPVPLEPPAQGTDSPAETRRDAENKLSAPARNLWPQGCGSTADSANSRELAGLAESAFAKLGGLWLLTGSTAVL